MSPVTKILIWTLYKLPFGRATLTVTRAFVLWIEDQGSATCLSGQAPEGIMVG